jgi:pimeloyl-ACP methyl ester carboxylesterase
MRRIAGRRNVPIEPVRQSPFALPDEQIERALRSGESQGLLEDYFGPASYAELRELAREAATRSVRGGPRVLILPGIMGSTLGKRVLLLEDILWLNPIEIGLGRLTELRLTGASKYHAVGVILLAYLKLKLRLRIAGFDATFHPFDWRLGLDTLGEQLADVIASDPASQVSIVAHSMGGLVARAALRRVTTKVKQLIMLGTPNYGSFAPVQVLRATYDVVLKVAALDLHHTAEELTSTVFNSFPGLYQMLPAPEKFGTIDLYDQTSWPAHGPRPDPALLAGVKPVISRLAPADSRFFLIAGVNQDTVTGVQKTGGDFTYEVSADGDGTVPLAFARLADIPDSHTYYVEDSHGSLPNNGAVERAVQDLLANGVTTALSNTRPAARRATRMVSEQDLRMKAATAITPGQLGASDFRRVLDAVAAPDSLADVTGPQVTAPGPSMVDAAGRGTMAPITSEFRSLIVGRRRQQRLELTVAHGSITEVQTRAYVLGIFKNVAPSGAANAIDIELEGAISEFTARRMFSGDVGEVFTIPMGRNSVRAEMVMLVGLGPFDRFNADVQQLVAENVVRTLVHSHLDEFATVLIGAGTGQGTLPIVQNLLTGFLRGLQDADKKHRFRGITLCETDASRFMEMKDALLRLASTPLFEGTELVLDEIELPASPKRTPSLQRGPDPIYLMIRQEIPTGTQLHFRGSLLGSGMKAAVVTAVQDVPAERFKTVLHAFDRAVDSGTSADAIDKVGAEIAALMMPVEIATALKTQRDRHLVVVHDAASSRIPWETLGIGDWRPSLEAGLSRRYLADSLPLATWLEQRRFDPTLRVLLLTNPTGDLDGADEEGNRLLKLAQSTPSVVVTEYRHEKATKPAILSALRSGAFDIVHYAGHAFFDAEAPGRSGLLCAGRQVLSGSDLTGISNLPCLVFFNACEAGRVRGRRPVPSPRPTARVHESYGVAEALMRGGVANYLSTYWPVGDAAAATFADTFYKGALSGKTIGRALLEARQAVKAAGSRDWSDYVLYGDSELVVKWR